MRLTKKQVSELKADLLQLKAELEAQASLQASQEFDTDEVSFGDHHVADDAGHYIDKQTKIAEDHLNSDQLNEVREALQRMEKGNYGICVDTGKEIPFERLKAIPYAKRTIEAEEKQPNLSPANDAKDTTKLRQSKAALEDARNQIFDRIDEEHK